MAEVDVDALRKLIDEAITQWVAGTSPDTSEVPSPLNEITSVADNTERVLPEGKRVVRTKTSGDRVYLLDDVKKTRQWVTNPEVLKASGFEIGDVTEVEDSEVLKYQMGPALYKVDGPA